MRFKGAHVRMLKNQFRRLYHRLFWDAAERRHSLVGPPKRWKMKREFQIQFLKNMGVKPSHFLIDIGCGTLRGGIPIIEYLDSGHYFGIEARPDVLAQGKKELNISKLEYKNPSLIIGEDLTTLELRKSVDFIWSFSVLIHMRDDMLNSTLGFVQRHLGKDGVFYANVNISDEPDGEWQGFPIVRRSWDFYEEMCRSYGLTVQDMGPLTDFGHSLAGHDVQSQSTKRMLKISIENISNQ